jgi:hypothetical protein
MNRMFGAGLVQAKVEGIIMIAEATMWRRFLVKECMLSKRDEV